MLKTIYCDKFLEKQVTFHRGLNVLVGDNIASNSIGKSTMLLIVDFVFGGDTYSKKLDIIENIGHHEFKFTFEFGDEEYYFIRGTTNSNIISTCDSNFQKIRDINKSEFTNLLREYYECGIEDISFRNIVGRYFRVYGKENLNEHKPLNYFNRERMSDAIINLLKLFNKYELINAQEKQLNDLEGQKKVLESAAKNELIPNIKKREYERNIKLLDEYKRKIDALKSNFILEINYLKSLLSEDVLNLHQSKSDMILRKKILENRLKRISKNLQNRYVDIKPELENFVTYFPSFKIDEIKKIDVFHEGITKALHSELKHAYDRTLVELEELNDNISRLDYEINSKINISDAPKLVIEQLVEYSLAVNNLETKNRFFDLVVEKKENIKVIKEKLKDIKDSIYFEVGNEINIAMDTINNRIYGEDRRSPSIKILEKTYEFMTPGDTGTGTAYANLITFDISILQLTKLPALIHDLPLLKNIENEAIENIIQIYNENSKQIFIALDKLNSYSENTAKTVNEKKFLELSRQKLLFTKNWKKATE